MAFMKLDWSALQVKEQKCSAKLAIHDGQCFKNWYANRMFLSRVLS